MAYQLSVAVRNAQADQFETTTGTAPVIRFYTGAQPADCAAAATGSLLATFSLPSDWLNNAAAGAKTKLGTWSGAASAAGTIGYFRIWDTAVANCHAQGSVTITAGGGDMTVDNTNIANAQVITITSFTHTMGGA